VLNDPLYSDSLGSQQAQRFSLNLESNAASPAGWYNETSIQSMAWDLYDSAADGSDAIALGYLPMFEAFIGPLKDGPALTSVYPFLASLRGRAGAPVAAINSLAGSQGINATDLYGTGETNSGSVSQALPIYTTLTLNGGPQRVCGTRTAGLYNRLGNRVFLKFTLSAALSVSIRAQYTATGSTAPFTPVPDPDIVLYRSGYLAISETTSANEETLTRTLEAGDYVVEVYEWSHLDLSPTAPTPRGNTCFNVSITG
jgi:hypothetical protein